MERFPEGTSPGPACSYVRADELGLATVGPGGRELTVAARPAADEPVLQRSPRPSGYVFSLEFTASFGEDGRLVVLFGHNLPHRWAGGAGAEVNLSVRTDEPFTWEAREATGPIHCVASLASYRGGTLVQAGSRAYGEDLRSSLEIDGRGEGWFIPYGDERWSYRLDGPDGTVFTSREDDPPLFGLAGGGERVKGLQPGVYEARVEEIVGKREAGAPYVVADLTPPVADALNASARDEPR